MVLRIFIDDQDFKYQLGNSTFVLRDSHFVTAAPQV